ncbi:MAG: hypothetical protein OEX07_03295 [Gammaproteobacteria bacterium]|nr:hypothetical protein [Gammaproteobacteria bacterium]
MPVRALVRLSGCNGVSEGRAGKKAPHANACYQVDRDGIPPAVDRPGILI